MITARPERVRILPVPGPRASHKNRRRTTAYTRPAGCARSRFQKLQALFDKPSLPQQVHSGGDNNSPAASMRNSFPAVVSELLRGTVRLPARDAHTLAFGLDYE